MPVDAAPDHEESAVDYAARTEVTLMFLRSLDERL
jgi:hypothetical protein